MTTMPYGFRVVGHRASGRRVVIHTAAFSGYAQCDPKAEVELEAFLSYFVYGDEFKQHFKREGSERAYKGTCAVPWLWWDVDRSDDLERALNDTRRLTARILDRYREYDEDDLLLFFSGAKGFHVGIPTVWNPEPSPSVNLSARSFATDLADSIGVVIDTSVYSKTRLFRAPNSRHSKTNLYKRRITYDELMHSTVEAIVARSREPEAFDIPTGPATCSQAAEDWNRATRSVGQRDERRAIRANGPANLTAFALRFLRYGEIEEGKRAVSVFRVAAEFGEFLETHGPDAFARALIEEPALDLGLTPSEVKRQIESGLSHARQNRRTTS